MMYKDTLEDILTWLDQDISAEHLVIAIRDRIQKVLKEDGC